MEITGSSLMQVNLPLFDEIQEALDEKQAKPYQKSWIDYFGTQENNCDQREVVSKSERDVAQKTLPGYSIFCAKNFETG